MDICVGTATGGIPVVATVIVTFNGAAWIERCLNSLGELSSCNRAIVVDNASADCTVQLVLSGFPQVELIQLQDNFGFGVGNNVGIAKALEGGAEFVFLLNQDAFATSGAISSMTSFLKSHSDYGVVSPLHCSPDAFQIDAKTFRYYLSAHATEWISDAAMGRAKQHYRIRGVNAAAWFVRASTFRTVGGFDPLFFMYGEDDDLIDRFHAHGVAFALLPEIKVVHLRQSPPSTPLRGWVGRVQRRAVRLRSNLLRLIKQPNSSKWRMRVQLLMHGVWVPLMELPLQRNLIEFAAQLLAVCKVMAEVHRVQESAQRCATTGAHFLPSPFTKQV